eukprot:TRINITY_DN10531_c0_g1_i10.p1 TRINITY_DN10531_c0_g1~~TRINITY_DN10531_c0_g1_i10.p1  ORF type:complete len:312 (+),score=30.36 TRINITY_DN10531_c0_g1_i10:87-1022(+)
MRISSRANVKALIFSLLCVELKALIASNTIEVGSFSLVPFAWFAYKSHGKYTIEVTSSREGEKLRLLLLVVASQNSCKTIGKPCVYEIPEIPDICTDMNATELNNKIIGAHPIIIPSYSYVFKRNTSNSRVSVESWNEYAALSNTPLKPFIENILMPGVVNASLLHYLEFTNFLEGDESSAQEIITEIDGDVHGTSYVYFSVLNCYKEPLSLSLKYEFSNPGGEQLSSTDTPQKVMFPDFLAHPPRSGLLLRGFRRRYFCGRHHREGAARQTPALAYLNSGNGGFGNNGMSGATRVLEQNVGCRIHSLSDM